jgi:hypothetical protein
MRRRRLHRVTFALAGAYNIAWGCYAVLDPQWFHRVTGLPLIITNDLVWWVPFALYLRDAWPEFRSTFSGSGLA